MRSLKHMKLGTFGVNLDEVNVLTRRNHVVDANGFYLNGLKRVIERCCRGLIHEKRRTSDVVGEHIK